MVKIRTRYAPSPTGNLHIGGARTALFAFLHAKSQGGEFLLRLEDTDQSRNLEHGESNQIEGLEWLGIKPDFSPRNPDDTGPFRQSERLDIYNKYIDQLLEEGHAYECWCSSEEIQADRDAQAERGIMSPVYNKKCLLNPEPKEGVTPTIRIKVPDNEEYSWDDGVRGVITVNSSEIGDWVIRKSDGLPTYNFANVIDDHLMNITDVHRGEEHISNTPRQLQLYKLFNWEPPRFFHMTIITGENGKKLSKRDEGVLQFIHLYKERGYLPKAIFNFLSLLGWSPEGEDEIFSPEELIKIFDPSRLSRAPSKFDVRKLQWTNNQYIQKLTDEELWDLLIPFVKDVELTDEQKKDIFKVFQPGLLEGIGIQDDIKLFTTERNILEDEKHWVVEGEEIIKVFSNKLNSLDNWDRVSIKSLMMEAGEELELKGAKLMKPIRIQLTGEGSGPDIATIIEIFGKEKTLERLNNG